MVAHDTEAPTRHHSNDVFLFLVERISFPKKLFVGAVEVEGVHRFFKDRHSLGNFPKNSDHARSLLDDDGATLQMVTMFLREGRGEKLATLPKAHLGYLMIAPLRLLIRNEGG